MTAGNVLNQRTLRPQSHFLPMVLILAGGLWLLRSFDIIGNRNLVALLRLWPLALVVIGVELLVVPRNARLGWWITIGAAAFALAFALFAPALGIGVVELKHGTFIEPIDSATSANVTVSPSVGKLYIRTATDTTTLFNAVYDHLGTMETSAQGTTEKTVVLRERDVEGLWGGWWGVEQEAIWNIALTDSLPISLTLNGGVSEMSLDLAALKLRDLAINTGVGRVSGTLPASSAGYGVTINGGVGEVRLNLPANTSIDVKVSGGVGSMDLDVPNDAAVRLQSASGVGTVSVLPTMSRTSGEMPGEGTWETAGFANASTKITIYYSGGVGSLTIR